MVIGNKAGAIMWLPANHCRPSYSLDQGATWQYCNLGPTVNAWLDAKETQKDGFGNYNGTIGALHAYTIHAQRSLADKLNPGTFYFYVVGDGTNDAGNLAWLGIWKSTDNCQTWSRIKSTFIISWGTDFWNVKLKQVPGKNGHFWFTCGGVNADGFPQSTSKLWYSTDHCVTWTEIPTTPNETQAYCFGKAYGSHPYPAVYVWQQSDGIHRCRNFDPANPAGATWEFLTVAPNGYFCDATDMAGDMGVYGRFYMTFGDMGAMRGRNEHKIRFS
jgi:hypothetical protein